MDNELRSKAINGVRWTSFYTIFMIISGLLYKLFLARTLVPYEYAYIAVLSLFSNLSVLVINLGIGEAIIQREVVTKEQLSTIFFLNFLLSLCAVMLLYFFAGVIQAYYKLENLDKFLRLLCMAIFVSGLCSFIRVFFQRKMMFKEIVISQIVRNLLDMTFSVAFILVGFGVIGYLYGTIIGSVASGIVLLLYAIYDPDMRLQLYCNPRKIKSFISFGVSISLKRILTFSSQNIDEFIIGGMVPAEKFGIYYFGKNLILQVQTLITSSFSQVLLPVFSRLEGEKTKLQEAYYKISYFISMVAFPILIIVSVTSHLFVPVIFGDKWIESIGVIRIFSIAAIFLVLTANVATSLLYAVNRPHLVLVIDIIMYISYISLLVILANISGMGILIASVVYSLQIIIKSIILQFFVNNVLYSSLIDYILNLKKIVIASVLTGSIVFVIETWGINDFGQLTKLIVCSTIGFCLYLVYEYRSDKKNMLSLISIITRKG